MAFGLNNLIYAIIGVTVVSSGAYLKGRADQRGASALATILFVAEERSVFRAAYASQVNATMAAVKSDIANSDACVAAIDASDVARAQYRDQLVQAIDRGERESDALARQLRKLAELQEDTNAGIAGAFDRIDPDIPCRVYGLGETRCHSDQPAASVAYGVPGLDVRERSAGTED